MFPLLPFKSSLLFLLLLSRFKINREIKRDARPGLVDILGSPFGAVKTLT